jgi:hypothetical protein
MGTLSSESELESLIVSLPVEVPSPFRALLKWTTPLEYFEDLWGSDELGRVQEEFKLAGTADGLELERVVEELAEKPISTSHGQAMSFANLYEDEFGRVRVALNRLRAGDPNRFYLRTAQSLVHELRLLANIYDRYPWVSVFS